MNISARKSLSIGIEKAKSQFFDRDLINTTQRAKKRVMYRFGALCRSIAKRSIRRTKNTSASPGEPPKAHTKPGIKKIWFYYDQSTDSVVIGPIKLPGAPTYQGKTVPALMEEGGVVRKGEGSGEGEIYHYSPHPFMGPAFDEAKKSLSEMWRDALN